MRRNFTKEAEVTDAGLVAVIGKKAHPLQSKAHLQPLYDRIGDARIVMLGEASHGTHEYYTWRAHISKKLIEDKGFSFIVVEGDWPDCYLLNRFVKGYAPENKGVFNVLHAFNRWPTWMWANWETVALGEWLQKHNTGLPVNKKVGFYGLDVYSLWESMESIMAYLEITDPSALKIAQKAFQCFEPYRQSEGQSYAQASQFVPELCETEVVNLLKEIRHRVRHYNTDHENVLSAEQNAIVAVNAERYYRAMVKGGAHTWNLRDQHMADTLDRLLNFHGKDAKVIVWAHNTHVGDARATDMVDEGMYTLGELARVRHREKGVVLVGFGSYNGTVMAGEHWGAPMQSCKMPDAKNGSWEHILHQAGADNKLLIMDDFTRTDSLMENHIYHRAIGVVYNPLNERFSNYVPSILPLRYDAFIFLDHTHALYPLHIEPEGRQLPETYPFGV